MKRIEIKCPECGSEEFECYDSYSMDGVYLEHCVCYDCDELFDVKYIAVEIKFNK